MNRCMVLSLIAFFTMSCASSQVSPKKAKPGMTVSYRDVSFASMKGLVGQWHKIGKPAKDFHINFSLTAGNTVLVESWVSRGKVHSLTLYHQDGAGLIATHYCPQGNQPRMVLEYKPNRQHVSFVFRDATNLASDKQSHQVALAFEFLKDTNTIIRHETYQGQKGLASSSLNLQRVK